MDSKPLISVIMATYNSSNYLKESVDSILSQSVGDFELIIINDNSTDNTKSIIDEYVKNDQRIKSINNERNEGPAASRNKGLKIAVGKYIAIQDSDDVSFLKRFQVQWDCLAENPGVFLVGGGVVIISENGERIAVCKSITNERKLKKKLGQHNVICHSSVMFRNERKYYYREKFKYSHDYDFYLTLISLGRRILNVQDVLVKYRFSKQAVSFAKIKEQYLFSEKALEFYWQRENLGQDEYDIFDPAKMLSDSNISYQQNLQIIKCRIKAYYRMKEYKQVRILYKKYLKQKKIPDKYAFYFVVSVFPGWLVDQIKRIVRR